MAVHSEIALLDECVVSQPPLPGCVSIYPWVERHPHEARQVLSHDAHGPVVGVVLCTPAHARDPLSKTYRYRQLLRNTQVPMSSQELLALQDTNAEMVGYVLPWIPLEEKTNLPQQFSAILRQFTSAVRPSLHAPPKAERAVWAAGGRGVQWAVSLDPYLCACQHRLPFSLVFHKSSHHLIHAHSQLLGQSR